MIDLNFLGHELELNTKYYPNYDYKCKICGIEVFYSSGIWFIITPNIFENNKLCTISCRDFLIKNIIE